MLFYFRDKSTLEAQIAKLKLNLEQKEGDMDGRYKKGSDVVEQQLREERNNLEIEIRRLKVRIIIYLFYRTLNKLFHFHYKLTSIAISKQIYSARFKFMN